MPTGTGEATVGSGSVVRARLRVAQSGLGRAGHWLVQEVALATAAAKAAKLRATARMTQEETGEGRRWCELKANPSPLFISRTR